MLLTESIRHLSDPDLLHETARAAATEREGTASLLALHGEIDARRLYLGQSCASLFMYCTQVLHLSEHAAYHRIEAARAARCFPVILKMVADGALTLTSVALLRPLLTPDNHQSVLDAAQHKTKREVEHQIACLKPRPDEPTVIRKLPVPHVQASASTLARPEAKSVDSLSTWRENEVSAMPAPRPVVTSLAPNRYLLKVTLSDVAHDRLRRAQDLMRHTIPSGDPAAIIDRALALLLEQLERKKLANTVRPRKAAPLDVTRSRQVSAAVRRHVWTRDGGRCAFVGANGRCVETGFLEFHHVEPFAEGGPTTAGNLELRCRAHKQHEADLIYGARALGIADPDEVASEPDYDE
jgi:hypothetical protein